MSAGCILLAIAAVFILACMLFFVAGACHLAGTADEQAGLK